MDSDCVELMEELLVRVEEAKGTMECAEQPVAPCSSVQFMSCQVGVCTVDT